MRINRFSFVSLLLFDTLHQIRFTFSNIIFTSNLCTVGMSANMKISMFFLCFTTFLCYQVEGYRILAVIALNGRSHFTFMEQLLKGLARQGHQVDVVSHFPLQTPYPNYRDFSLEGSLPDLVNNMSYNQLEDVSGFNMKKFFSTAGDNVCELLGHPILQNIIKNPPKDHPYDLYITEVNELNLFLDVIVLKLINRIFSGSTDYLFLFT